jgi:hypothetical protein
MNEWLEESHRRACEIIDAPETDFDYDIVDETDTMDDTDAVNNF